MRQKIELYIISLWLLFVLIIVNRIKVNICFGCKFISIYEFIFINLIPSVAFVFLIIGLILYYKFKSTINGSKLLPVRIIKIENVNYEHLTFLTTYIIPLICFDLAKIQYAITLLILLVIIGIIHVKTNMFYANPTLALLGFNIYQVETSQGTNIVYISTDKLVKGIFVSSLKLDSRTYFVKISPNNE